MKAFVTDVKLKLGIVGGEYIDDEVEFLLSKIPLNDRREFFRSITETEQHFLKPMDRLKSSIDKYLRKYTKKEDEAVLSYCKSFVAKCRNIAVQAEEQKPKGLCWVDFANKAKYSNFTNANTKKEIFNDKEKMLLDEAGGCARFLLDYDSNEFLEDIYNAVKRLRSIKKVEYKDNKVLKLIKGQNEK